MEIQIEDISPSKELLATIQKLSTGNTSELTKETLLSALKETLQSVSKFAAVTAQLQEMIGKITTAYVQCNSADLDRSMNELIKRFCQQEEQSQTLH
jgi:acetamidase/formamidase